MSFVLYKELLEFRENIDTECENISILKIKAIKLDESKNLKISFRQKMKMGHIGCCDYIRFSRDNLILIEFSDLIKQKRALEKKYDNIKNSDKVIREENINKIKNTLLLISHYLKSKKRVDIYSKKFILGVCSDSKSDLIAFEKLKLELISAAKPLIDTVSIIPINNKISIKKYLYNG